AQSVTPCAHHGRDTVGVELVVRIEKEQHFAMAGCKAGVERGNVSTLRFSHELDAVGKARQDRERVVGRAVVDNDDLKRAVGLRKRALQGLSHEARIVEVNDDYGYEGSLHVRHYLIGTLLSQISCRGAGGGSRVTIDIDDML